MGKAVYYARDREGVDAFSYDAASENGVVHVFVTVRSAPTAVTPAVGSSPAGPLPEQPPLPTPAQLLAGEPMRIALVRGQGPGCDPDCPTWIAAVGKIMPGTAERLSQVIRSLDGRRVPILVNSPGGYVSEAMAMGRLIRRSGLSVAVAHTSFAQCQPAGATCTDLRAATSFAAVCASACSLVLAGGVRRYVSNSSYVGVHEPMTLMTVTRSLRQYETRYRMVGGRKEEISRRLVSEKRSSNSTVVELGEAIERSAADYFSEMGVGEPAISLTASTPSGMIRRLTMPELRDFRLATHVLDGPFPIRGGGGLNGLKAVSIDNGATGDTLAETNRPVTLNGRAAEADLEIRRRPGGGDARLEIILRDPESKEPLAAGKNGAILSVAPAGPAFIARPRRDRKPRMVASLALICQLRGARTATLTLFDDDAGSAGSLTSVPIDIEALGAEPFLDEACPSVRSTRR